jgi:hypothetical protein
MIQNMSNLKSMREQIQSFPTGPGLYFMKGPKLDVGGHQTNVTMLCPGAM